MVQGDHKDWSSVDWPDRRYCVYDNSPGREWSRSNVFPIDKIHHEYSVWCDNASRGDVACNETESLRVLDYKKKA